MQQAGFDSLGLSWRYLAIDLEQGELAGMAGRLRQPQCAGANVTVPHKRSMLALVDSLSAQAKRLSAVNTIVNVEGRLVAENTDYRGFAAMIARGDLGDLGERSVVLLGAGGAARSCLAVLTDRGVGRVHVVARISARGYSMLDDLQLRGDRRITVHQWAGATSDPDVMGSEVIVNATPLGLHGELAWPLQAMTAPKLVLDLAYRRGGTALCNAARSQAIPSIGGELMLLEQGAAAFELWTGLAAPAEAMAAALAAAISN